MTGLNLTSKLPDVGTTIFTVMSQAAQEHGALNLSQGFPDFDAPVELLDAVERHFRSGRNQYAPMTGVPELRTALADKVQRLYGRALDPESEVTVTSGATEALFCAIAATVGPGDEVIVFDPAYDSYEPAVRLQGGRTCHIPLLAPDYRVDWGRVREAIKPRTRLIIINTPHNPTGSVWSAQDLLELKQIVREHDLFLLADEVYEHMVFDGAEHQSLCRDPELFARSFVVSSLGKTYHVTGWKIGYCCAPAQLSREFRKVHQYVTFTSITPVQLGLADYLVSHPQHYEGLAQFYAAKRDLFCRQLADSRFQFEPSAGTYFQLLRYGDITTAADTQWVMELTQEVKLAAIPVSVFYAGGSNDLCIRLCFAKDDATLEAAAQILCRL